VSILFFGLYYFYEDVQSPCHQDGDAKADLCQIHRCSYDIDVNTMECRESDLSLDAAGAITGALAFSGFVLLLLGLCKYPERREWTAVNE